jgi:thioesterase domain-containing protein/acyl carrier protein
MNQYGPTETHVVSAYQLDPKNVDQWPLFPPIGTAISNMQLIVGNEELEPMPMELPGELFISGVNVARGYLNQPIKTQEKFIQVKGTRFYASGDKVKLNSSGQLEFLGRFDDQIKVRGYRVDLIEIEACILQLAGIKQCKVITAKNETNQQQILCYCTTFETHENFEQTIRQQLSHIVPDYMLPNYFIFLDEFPLTVNGKIDTHALPLPEWQKQNSLVENNIYEKELVQIWAKLLGNKNFHVNSHFFEMGGHSLSALRLLLSIEKHFNIKLSIQDLLNEPTISQLALRIQQKQANTLLNQQETLLYKEKLLPFPIISLQTHGEKPPLFIIHPIGGTIFWFLELARYLDKNQPIYGIQDPSIFSDDLLFTSLSEMAAYYLHCIQQIHPKGPFVIAGSSFGATIAFEIAKQLESRNEQVAFVGLFDGWAIYPEAVRNKAFFEKNMQRQMQDLLLKFDLYDLANAKTWIARQWHRNQLLQDYQYQPIQAPLTLFKAEELTPELSSIDAPDNFWEKFTSHLEIIKIPGDHETIFQEPNVKSLAQALRGCLNKIA